MDPLVSVILPVYNYKNYLEYAISSVLNQSYTNIELIAIDNFSTDGSREILEKYSSNVRVRTIFHDRNYGGKYSYNEGLRLARGEYIAILNADDIYHKDKIKKQVSFLEKNSEYDLVYTDAEIIDKKGRKTGKKFSNIFKIKKRMNTGYVYDDLKKSNFIVFPTILFRRKCLEYVSVFDNELTVCIDWWFLLELSRKYKFFYIDDVLTYYRVHDKNDSLLDRKRFYKDYSIIYKRLLERHPEDTELIKRYYYYSILLGETEKIRRNLLTERNLSKIHKIIFYIATYFPLPLYLYDRIKLYLSSRS